VLLTSLDSIDSAALWTAIAASLYILDMYMQLVGVYEDEKACLLQSLRTSYGTIGLADPPANSRNNSSCILH
jgi:hypothetical protein